MSYGQCHRGLCVEHQNKNVSVQTMVINPVIEVLWNINTWRVDKHDVVSQQAAAFPRPENANQRTLRQFVLVEGVCELLDWLKLKVLMKLKLQGLKSVALTVTLSFSSEPSFSMYPSCPSTPSTWQKQLVVCPMPLGRILSRNIALMTELFPFDVRPKNATFIWFRAKTSRMLFIFNT